MPARRRFLTFVFAMLLIAAACETESDSTDGSAPLPDVTLDTAAPAPAPAPPSTDTPANPAVPAPDAEDDADVAPAPDRPDPPSAVIPAAYRGKWDRTTAACAESSSVMRLNIDASTLRFYEGRSRVLAVRNVAGGIEVDVEHMAEGTTDRRTYRLARSGDQLTVTISGNAATRVRCLA